MTTLWEELFGPPIAVSAACCVALMCEPQPLQLPHIEALDLRPCWEQHPTADLVRRGERAWQSALSLYGEHVPLTGLR